jgi:16S rRNA (cytidine1402-2'-O)-methyltransferase
MTESADNTRLEPLGITSLTWDAVGLPQQDFPAGLYVVAMPLGNAADVSLRALWVLAHADVIACEDTRTSAPLLSRYGVQRRHLVAVHQHNETAVVPGLLDHLAQGERVVLISDAGTPAISDPGAILVRQVRAAGYRVIPIPGPSSLTAVLSVAGVAGDVLFAGFAPAQGSARKRHWERFVSASYAVVVFEAPHRIEDLAREWLASYGADRPVLVARELTKKFESIASCTTGSLLQTLQQTGSRGEFVLILLPDPAQSTALPADDPLDETTKAWLHALQPELPASRLAAVVAKLTGRPRSMLYQYLTELRGRD